MQIPLVVDQSDYRWELLKEILKIFDLKRVRKIIARYASLKVNFEDCNSFDVLLYANKPCN